MCGANNYEIQKEVSLEVLLNYVSIFVDMEDAGSFGWQRPFVKNNICLSKYWLDMPYFIERNWAFQLDSLLIKQHFILFILSIYVR